MNVHDIPKLRLGIEFVTSFLPSIQEKVHYTSLKIEKINCKWVIPTDAEANKVLLYLHLNNTMDCIYFVRMDHFL